MAYEYEITDVAYEEIDNAINYIINKLFNQKAASNLLEELEKSLNNICEFPMSYPDCSYYYVKDKNIRHAIIKNYVLVFKINDKKITILRFKHSKQNIINLS